MKAKFIETESRYQAKKACPWASRTAKVCGGYFTEKIKGALKS